MDTMSEMGSRTGTRRTRRRFSEEFKTDAIRLVVAEGKSVGAAAREFEVFYNQRRRQSTLGQISPAAFERRAMTQAA